MVTENERIEVTNVCVCVFFLVLTKCTTTVYFKCLNLGICSAIELDVLTVLKGSSNGLWTWTGTIVNSENIVCGSLLYNPFQIYNDIKR